METLLSLKMEERLNLMNLIQVRELGLSKSLNSKLKKILREINISLKYRIKTQYDFNLEHWRRKEAAQKQRRNLKLNNKRRNRTHLNEGSQAEGEEMINKSINYNREKYKTFPQFLTTSPVNDILISFNYLFTIHQNG